MKTLFIAAFCLFTLLASEARAQFGASLRDLQNQPLVIPRCSGGIPIQDVIGGVGPVLCMSDSLSCDCINGNISRMSPEGLQIAQAGHQQLQRAGYGSMLHWWLSEYSTYISNSDINNIPQACQFSNVRANIAKRVNDNSCQKDMRPFQAALTDTLGDLGKWKDLRIAQDINEKEILKQFQERNRLYRIGHGSQQTVLRDCMESGQLSAITFLKSPGGKTAATPSIDEVMSDLQEFERLVKGPDSEISLELLRTKTRYIDYTGNDARLFRTLGIMYDIFPGLRVTMEDQLNAASSKQEILPLFQALSTYAKNISKLHIKDLDASDKPTRDRFLASLQKESLEITKLVSAHLAQTEKTAPGQSSLEKQCTDLTNQLVGIACSPERFTAVPQSLAGQQDADQFMNQAMALANQQNTAFEGISSEQVLKCNQSRAASSEGDRNFSDCLNYNMARCSNIPSPNTSASDEDINDANLWITVGGANTLNLARREDAGRVVGQYCRNFNDFIDVSCRAHEDKAKCASSVGLGAEYKQFLASRNIKDDIVESLSDHQWGYGTMGKSAASLNPMTARTKPIDSVSSGSSPVVESSVSLHPAATANTVSTPTTLAAARPNDTTTSTVRPVENLSPVEKIKEVNALNDQIAQAQSRLANLQQQAANMQNNQLRDEIARLKDKISADEKRRAEIADSGDVDEAGNPTGKRKVKRAIASTEETAETEIAPAKVARAAARGAAAAVAASAVPASTGSSNSSSSSSEGGRSFANTVDSTYQGSGGSGGGLIREMNRADIRSAAGAAVLTISGKEYPVTDIGQVVIPEGRPATDDSILAKIGEMQDKLKFDDQQRAMVEVYDENTKTAKLYYVQRQGRSLAFLQLPKQEMGQQIEGVRRRLQDLKRHLKNTLEVTQTN